MDRQLSLLLILVFATGAMAGIMRQIIGGHDVKKRSINEALHFEVIAPVDDYHPDYPQEKVDKILDELERKNLRIIPDVLEDKYSGENETLNYINLCESTTGTHALTVIKDNNNKTHYVLNSKNRIIQLIRYEICISSNESEKQDIYETCQHTEAKPSMAARCHQTYVTAYLYTLSDKEDKPSLVNVKIPSSCTCYVFREES